MRQFRLRYALVGSDATSIVIGTLLSVALLDLAQTLPDAVSIVAFSTGAGLLILRSQGLFLARVSSIRVIEAARLARSMALHGFALFGLDRLLGLGLDAFDIVATSSLCLLTLVISRSGYRAWVGWARQSGRFIRRVVIIGSDDEALRMIRLFEVHKEVGIEVVGVFGDRVAALQRGMGDLWRGRTSDVTALTPSLGAVGAVVCPGALTAGELNVLIRELHDQGVHVHLGLGLAGVDTRRLQSLPLAYEPLLYCDPLSVSEVQLIAKRVFDVVGSAVALIVALPLMLAIAIAIKLDDGGPVLFRQKRVGLNGALFGVMKFRTMHVDAEARLADLQRNNERNGPLFKMDRDPRVTRVGNFLRSSSLDELPQLFNVVKGEMSLIGPRPALPSEVAQFPEEVRIRERVRPGITGLWQVEARDNPSFDAYQRLDGYYLENWSILLDAVIIVGTIEQVCLRFVATMLRRRAEPTPPPVVLAVVPPVDVDGDDDGESDSDASDSDASERHDRREARTAASRSIRAVHGASDAGTVDRPSRKVRSAPR